MSYSFLVTEEGKETTQVKMTNLGKILQIVLLLLFGLLIMSKMWNL